MNDSKTDIHWYALRVTYSRELTVKEYLDGAGIENFIPMHYEYVTKGDRRVRKLVPVVHNLVFVRSSREHINRMKEELSLPIRYIMNKETNHPIIVPERQMHHFIAVAGTNEEQLVYLEPTAVAFRKGQRVRVTGGVFEGVEGEFIRVKNDRRVMVSIQGVMAVATTFIHPSFIELINE
ncbi:UpxY family transcription antiterminator [Bacteroides sp.]